MISLPLVILNSPLFVVFLSLTVAMASYILMILYWASVGLFAYVSLLGYMPRAFSFPELDTVFSECGQMQTDICLYVEESWLILLLTDHYFREHIICNLLNGPFFIKWGFLSTCHLLPTVLFAWVESGGNAWYLSVKIEKLIDPV